MARTKASVGAKLSCGKSSKARNLNAAPPPSGSPSTSGCKVVASGNAYCPRPTPPWQSPITRFFLGGPQETAELGGSSSEAAKPREETSDTESDQETSSRVEAMDTDAAPVDLDSSIVSNNGEERPISPDPTSHKIVEYFESSKGDSRGDHNGDLRADSKTMKTKVTTTPGAKNKGKGKGKGKKTIEKATENSEEDKLVSESDRQSNVLNSEADKQANGNDKQSNEKENLKPKANTIKAKDGYADLKKTEKRELLEVEENDKKRTRIV